MRIVRMETFDSANIGDPRDPALGKGFQPAAFLQESSVFLAEQRAALLGIALVIFVIASLKFFVMGEFFFELGDDTLFFQARELLAQDGASQPEECGERFFFV